MNRGSVAVQPIFKHASGFVLVPFWRFFLCWTQRYLKNTASRLVLKYVLILEWRYGESP